MGHMEDAVLSANTSKESLTAMIQQYTPFILRCASRSVGRFVTKSDDEWSVALLAFSDAVQTYSQSKGGFPTYARTVIRNRLVDYHRAEQKHRMEQPVNPTVFSFDPDSEEVDVRIQLSASLSYQDSTVLKEEIQGMAEVLKAYGYSFYDLAAVSPKAEKTKNACAKAVRYLLETPDILEEVKASKQLPIKKIQIATDLPRKIIEHHRKYIIAAMEILSGEYPCLAEYVSFIRKEEL